MPSFTSPGYDRHGIRFVHYGDVVEDAFAILIHTADPILDDDRDFIRQTPDRKLSRWHGKSEHMAVAVLVLQSFSPESSGVPKFHRGGKPRMRMSAAAQMKSAMRWKPNIE